MSIQDLKDLILSWIPDNNERLISPERVRNAYYDIIDFFWDVIGDKSKLETTDKSSIVGAINELKQDVGNAIGFDITEIILTNGQSFLFPEMSKGEAFVIRIIENDTTSQNGMVWLGGYDGVGVGNDTVVICVSNSVGGSYSDVGYQFAIINQGVSGLTNDDNTLTIDEDIIRLNVTNITEEFTANGTDRRFEMTNVYASIENVFINGVRIKSSDYITISEQEIEIEEGVKLLSGDEVVIQGTMFIE